MFDRISVPGFLVSMAIVCSPLLAWADMAAGPDTILLGQSTALTGPLSQTAKEETAGAELYFNSVNAKGGIAGRKIVLKTVDDGGDPKRAATNVDHLVHDDHVFALFLMQGTEAVQASLPLIDSEGVPLIAPVSGSSALRKPFNKMVFNARAKYTDEVAAAVNHLITSNLTTIGMVYINNDFGLDARLGFEAYLETRKIKPSLMQGYLRQGELSARADAFVVAKPQAIIVVAPSADAVKFITTMRKAGSLAQFVTLSNNAEPSFVTALGTAGPGVVITQVVPGSTRGGTIVQEYSDLAKAQGTTGNNRGMQGFIAAKVLVEGLKRAGKTLTRDHLVSSLETLRHFDLGGPTMTYTAEDHSGTNYVEVTSVSSNGEMVR